MLEPNTGDDSRQHEGGSASLFRIRQPTFGKRLRSARLEKGLSQRDLATGVVSPSYISHLESGQRVPTLDVVVHLAERLGVRLDQLVTVRNPPASDAVAAEPTTALHIARAHDQRGLDEAGTTLAAASADFERARTDGDTDVLVRSGMRLQAMLRSVDATERRGAVLDAVSEALSLAGHVDRLGPITLDRASIARDLGQLGSALALIEEAEHQLRASPTADAAQAVRLHAVRLSILADLDRTDEVLPAITKLLAATEQVTEPGVIGRARWTASIAFARVGDHAAALAQLELAKSSLDGSTSIADWIRLSRTAAQILLECGEPDLALSYLEDAERASKRLGLTHDQGQIRLLHAQYLLATGDPAAACTEALDELGSGAPAAGYDLQQLRWVAAEASCRIGDVDTAIDQLRLIASEAEARGAYRASSKALRRLDEVRSAR